LVFGTWNVQIQLITMTMKLLSFKYVGTVLNNSNDEIEESPGGTHYRSQEYEDGGGEIETEENGGGICGRPEPGCGCSAMHVLLETDGA
jgi:hypothetical protein